MNQPRPDEFWILIALHMENLAKSHNKRAVEDRMLPLLYNLNFLSQCKNFNATVRIISALQRSGADLDEIARKLLSSELVSLAFTAENESHMGKCLQVARRILRASSATFLKLVRRAAEEVEETVVNGHQRDMVHKRRLVIYEELCLHLDEATLLSMSAPKSCSTKVEADNSDGALKSSELGRLLRVGLQAAQTSTRLRALRLAGACALQSFTAFVHLRNLLEAGLYLEDDSTREAVLAMVLDAVFVHHHCLDFDRIYYLILPFLLAPTTRLQLEAVVGLGRLLLADAFGNSTEAMLSAMVERYVSKATTFPGVDDRQISQALHIFFVEYNGPQKDKHCDEVANTVVYMVLESISDGTVAIVDGGTRLQDSPARLGQLEVLHFGVKFCLNLCGPKLVATVAHSIVLNLNEGCGPRLSEAECLRWLTSQP